MKRRRVAARGWIRAYWRPDPQCTFEWRKVLLPRRGLSSATWRTSGSHGRCPDPKPSSQWKFSIAWNTSTFLNSLIWWKTLGKRNPELRAELGALSKLIFDELDFRVERKSFSAASKELWFISTTSSRTNQRRKGKDSWFLGANSSTRAKWSSVQSSTFEEVAEINENKETIKNKKVKVMCCLLVSWAVY